MITQVLSGRDGQHYGGGPCARQEAGVIQPQEAGYPPWTKDSLVIPHRLRVLLLFLTDRGFSCYLSKTKDSLVIPERLRILLLSLKD